MTEENPGYTDKGRFTTETRLLVACYICDENDSEIENYKDYAKKGKSVKIVTEEFEQEIPMEKGRRRYCADRSNELVYWMDNVKLYYPEDVTQILSSTRESDSEILNDMRDFIRGDIIKDLSMVSDNITPANAFNRLINDYNNNNIARRSIFKPVVSFQPDPIPGVIDPEFPDIIPNPIIPPPCDIVDENSDTTYYHLQIVDRFCNHDSFEDSPLALIDRPDDCRQIPFVSEIYIRRFPSLMYIANSIDGLDVIINKIVNDPKIRKFNLEKIIIAEHVSIELKRFYPASAYAIKNETLISLFKLFKKVEITNPVISITFPPTEILVNDLIVKNCKIYANNSIVKVDNLTLENCTFYNNDNNTGQKHIVFNVKSDIDLRGITFNDVIKLSFLSEEDDINATINSITYDCDGSGKNITGALLNLIKFTDTSLTGITKSENCILPSIQLFSFKDCITVKVNEIALGDIPFNGTLFSSSGFDDFSLNEITGNLTTNTGTLCSLSGSGTEANIKFTGIKTNSLDKLCNIVGCDINEFNIVESELSLNKLVSNLNSSTILFKFDNSTITFKENIDINLDTFTLENSKLFGKEINFISKNIITLSKSNITSEKLNINLKNVAKISSSDSSLDCKSINITGQTDNENSSSKIDFVKTSIEGDECIFKSLDVISCNYLYIMSKLFNIDNCKLLDVSDITLRLNRVNKMILSSISDTKQSSFLLENGGTIDIETNKNIGTLKFEVKSDCAIRRKCTNGRFAEIYTNDDNNSLSIMVDSTGCISSLFKVDKKYLNIKVLCEDFKLFKSTPENFNVNIAGKEKYDYIYYGN